MKTWLFLLFTITVLFTSCVKITQSEPIQVKCKVIYNEHQDSKTEYTYHYGYSFMKGKFCYHYGPEDISEKNIVKFVFLDDTLTRDRKALFGKDTLCVTYVKMYEDSIFTHNSITEIK
jgi:hypothetical protein